MTTPAEHEPTIPSVELQPRVLIVDDEAAQMEALCETLREHGYETCGTADPMRAIELVLESAFEVILADLMMPKLDGISLLQRSFEIQPELVGIIMTGEGTIASAVESMKAGAFDYILKPFKLSVILPVLSRAVTMRRLRIENIALERRLRENMLKLESANRELEAFSYSVSHDLRAPLRRVLGFSAILLEDHAEHLPPDARILVDKLTSAATGMDRLISDLLEFSRLSREPLVKREIDVTTLVQQALDELHEQYKDSSVDIRVETVPKAMGDASLMKQVFVNLLSNAIKFTRNNPNGCVEVAWRQEGGEQVFIVRDNGVGFDMRYAGKLFGAFQRMHPIEEFEGTGIGLSIVQRIVHRHGGRIWAEAAVGKGAAFYFTLSD